MKQEFLNAILDICIIGIIIGFFVSKALFIISFIGLIVITLKNRMYYEEPKKVTPATYKYKKILTDNEYNFYLKLKELEYSGYIIIPQVNLAAIIEKTDAKFRTDLFRNIDFGIFDQKLNLKLLIELNDKTHKEAKRKDRDLKVKKILDACNIKLINFYTTYPNEASYVVNRIKNTIENPKTPNN